MGDGRRLRQRPQVCSGWGASALFSPLPSGLFHQNEPLAAFTPVPEGASETLCVFPENFLEVTEATQEPWSQGSPRSCPQASVSRSCSPETPETLTEAPPRQLLSTPAGQI